MSFANPASDAQAAAPTYTRQLLELLGDRDPLKVQEGLLESLERATAGISDTDLRRPEAAGKWSIMEVVQHLADSEIVYGYRCRAILTEDNPHLAGYDQDVWVRRLRYNQVQLEDALAQLAPLRAANLRLLRTLTPEELARTGLHSERGPESVEHITKLLAAHDLIHLRQIERIKTTLGLG